MIYTSHTPLTAWLSPDKVKVSLGPDCDTSPHPVREVPLDLSIPYIDMLLGPQKPARGTALEESQTVDYRILPAPEEVAGDAAIAGGQLSSIRCVRP